MGRAQKGTMAGPAWTSAGTASSIIRGGWPGCCPLGYRRQDGGMTRFCGVRVAGSARPTGRFSSCPARGKGRGGAEGPLLPVEELAQHVVHGLAVLRGVVLGLRLFRRRRWGGCLGRFVGGRLRVGLLIPVARRNASA